MQDEIAICNIDGSFTNEIDLKPLDDEVQTLRDLWNLRLMKKGNANPDDAFTSNASESILESRFCRDVREYFLHKLDPFLRFLEPENHEQYFNVELLS